MIVLKQVLSLSSLWAISSFSLLSVPLTLIMHLKSTLLAKIALEIQACVSSWWTLQRAWIPPPQPSTSNSIAHQITYFPTNTFLCLLSGLIAVSGHFQHLPPSHLTKLPTVAFMVSRTIFPFLAPLITDWIQDLIIFLWMVTITTSTPFNLISHTVYQRSLSEHNLQRLLVTVSCL